MNKNILLFSHFCAVFGGVKAIVDQSKAIKARFEVVETNQQKQLTQGRARCLESWKL